MFGGYRKSKFFIRLSHSLYLRDEKKIRLFPAPATGGGVYDVGGFSFSVSCVRECVYVFVCMKESGKVYMSVSVYVSIRVCVCCECRGVWGECIVSVCESVCVLLILVSVRVHIYACCLPMC